MRLLPDTLFGRLISAVLGVVAVALIVIVALVARERSEYLFAGSEAEAIATTIADTATATRVLSSGDDAAGTLGGAWIDRSCAGRSLPSSS